MPTLVKRRVRGYTLLNGKKDHMQKRNRGAGHWLARLCNGTYTIAVMLTAGEGLASERTVWMGRRRENLGCKARWVQIFAAAFCC